MKKYVIEVTIEEGCDEFWEGLEDEDSTGCDQVLSEIRNSLYHWVSSTDNIKLVKFTNKER